MPEIRNALVTMLAAGLFLGSLWLGGPRATRAWRPAITQLGATIGDAAAEADSTRAGVVVRAKLTFTRVLQAPRSEARGNGLQHPFSLGAVEPVEWSFTLPTLWRRTSGDPEQRSASSGAITPPRAGEEAASWTTVPSLSMPPPDERVQSSATPRDDDETRADRGTLRVGDDHRGSGGSGGGDSYSSGLSSGAGGRAGSGSGSGGRSAGFDVSGGSGGSGGGGK